jgi:subtilisin
MRAYWPVIATLVGMLSVGASSAVAADSIVLLREGASAQHEANRAGGRVTQAYAHVGAFMADLSSRQHSDLKSDPDVLSITVDRGLSAQPDPVLRRQKIPVEPFGTAQVIPTGVRRIGGLASPSADIDGIDERVGVDVAIFEETLDPSHPDLNVAGNVNCAPGAAVPDWHAMHAAGVVGALDNGRGVVGVAPGARIWGVDMFYGSGRTRLSWILCGLDWLIANGDMLEVVNWSVGFTGFDDPNCGVDPPDPVHAAICRSVEKGTTWVVSAGNDSVDAVDVVPAAFDEVIAVSALADYDGRPGGLGQQSCLQGFLDLGGDDTFAVYSNFGADIDLMAPGNCILSTAAENAIKAADAVTNVYRDGSDLYAVTNGTSFSSPHVAGAAALYAAGHPQASPSQVLAALRANREPGHVLGDPDGIDEGIVNVAGL